MIRFPLTARIVHAVSNPQGWAAAIDNDRIEQFSFTGERTAIPPHNSIRHWETYKGKHVLAFFLRGHQWDGRISYWTPDGKTTRNPEEAWTYSDNGEFSFKIIGIEHLDGLGETDEWEMIVQHLSGVKEGMVVIKDDPFNCQIVTMPRIIKAFVAHDGRTIFVATKDEVIILDNPLM